MLCIFFFSFVVNYIPGKEDLFVCVCCGYNDYSWILLLSKLNFQKKSCSVCFQEIVCVNPVKRKHIYFHRHLVLLAQRISFLGQCCKQLVLYLCLVLIKSNFLYCVVVFISYSFLQQHLWRWSTAKMQLHALRFKNQPNSGFEYLYEILITKVLCNF